MEAAIHCVRQASTHTSARSEIMVSTDNFRQHFICTRSEDRLNLLTFESSVPTGFHVRADLHSGWLHCHSKHTWVGLSMSQVQNCLTEGAAPGYYHLITLPSLIMLIAVIVVNSCLIECV